jgi:hypothetical protein
MEKISIKTLLFFLLLLGYDKALAQRKSMPMDQFAEKFIKDSLRAILYRVEVGELNYKKEWPFSFDLGEQFIYAGDLVNAVTILTNVSIARVKTLGKIPDKHISFWGERFNSDMERIGRTVVKPKQIKTVEQEDIASIINNMTKSKSQDDPAYTLIINVLKMTYGFTITDIEDTCEVWAAKVINEEKLSTFIKNIPHPSSGSGPIDKNGKQYLEITNFYLSPIWKDIESYSKHIVYDETNDERRFDMLIEYEKLNDFNTANETLAPFGLRLFKEKRLEKLKLVEFHD